MDKANLENGSFKYAVVFVEEAFSQYDVIDMTS